MKVTDYERVNSVQDSDVLLIDGNRGTKTIYVGDLGFVNEEEYEEDIYGVNLLPNTATTKTENGITFTVNSDLSVTVSGTATAGIGLVLSDNITLPAGKYILTGDNIGDGGIDVAGVYLTMQIEGVNYDVTSITHEKTTNQVTTFTVKQFRIWVNSGVTINTTIYPMLRKATIKDDTYRPFNQQSIQNQLTDQTNVLGAKNRFHSLVKTNTYLGITYSSNGDEVFTLNGTASSGGNSGNIVSNSTELTNLRGKYIISVNVISGSSTKYTSIAFRKSTSSFWEIKNLQSNVGKTLTMEVDLSDNEHFDGWGQIYVQSKAVCTNLKFNVMIYSASIPDNTFVPYAMTNRELTEGKLDSSVAGVDEDETTAKVAHQYGTHFVKNGKYCRALDYIGVGATFSLGTNYIEETITNAYDTKYITSSTDLNTLFDPGYYMWANSVPVNTPDSVSYCIMRVIVSSGISRIQIIYCGGKMYQRIYTSQGWQSWYKFTGTVVS